MLLYNSIVLSASVPSLPMGKRQISVPYHVLYGRRGGEGGGVDKAIAEVYCGVPTYGYLALHGESEEDDEVEDQDGPEDRDVAHSKEGAYKGYDGSVGSP